MKPHDLSSPFRVIACSLLTAMQSIVSAEVVLKVYPAPDPANSGKWHLVEELSDEFNADELDTQKWHIQGEDGKYFSNFIGRAPSQFSTENVRLENGMLKLETRWEPSFDFFDKIDHSDKNAEGGRAYENITTAAVIGKQKFLYGYMEIRCKAADASVTSSFWMTGNNVELDVFEFLARPGQRHKTHLESELWSSIHDWSKPGGPTTWTDRLQLDWRVGGDFHIYGIEWTEDYLKFHADGQLVRTVTKEQVGEEGWVVTKPIRIWVDSETFPWHGIPVEQDLPVDYEIDYIRVWQNESTRGRGVLGFEKPHVSKGSESEWWIPPASRESFVVVGDKAASGERSLKLSCSEVLAEKAVAFAPYGSLNTSAAEGVFMMKVWLEPNCTLRRLNVVLEDPWLELKPFDLTQVPKGEWFMLKQTFRRPAPSGEKDRPRIVLLPGDTHDAAGSLYIDDIAIEQP